MNEPLNEKLLVSPTPESPATATVPASYAPRSSPDLSTAGNTAVDNLLLDNEEPPSVLQNLAGVVPVHELPRVIGDKRILSVGGTPLTLRTYCPLSTMVFQVPFAAIKNGLVIQAGFDVCSFVPQISGRLLRDAVHAYCPLPPHVDFSIDQTFDHLEGVRKRRPRRNHGDLVLGKTAHCSAKSNHGCSIRYEIGFSQQQRLALTLSVPLR